MIKLIVLDYDGTLLNSKKEITERNFNALHAVLSKGIKVMVASARPFYRLRPMLKKLEIEDSDQYTISFNGGLVINNTAEEIVFSGSFSDKDVKEIVEIGKQVGTNMFLYESDRILSNVEDKVYQRKNPDVKFHVIENMEGFNFNNEKIYKIAYVNSPEKTKRLKSELPIEMFNNYEITSSVPQFVEIVPKGVTKAHALNIIGNKLHISAEEMMAFGDEDNDLPMIEYVGCGIAMGNATEQIKRKADYITATNDANGVAQAIDHFFVFNKWGENQLIESILSCLKENGQLENFYYSDFESNINIMSLFVRFDGEDEIKIMDLLKKFNK